jgi:D-glycero-D-manno-heptose 1,7-bisphosphate phosphatase
MPLAVVFLDKDGTLIKNAPYPTDLNRMEWAPRVWEGLRALAETGFHFIIVTNQPGMAHGTITPDAMNRTRRLFHNRFADHGLLLLDFFYCPHHPDGTVGKYRKQCRCRKPSDGLLRKANTIYDIDSAQSWFIGDILDDIECGRRFGCRTVLINNGNETEWALSPARAPDIIVDNFKKAAEAIVQTRQHLGPLQKYSLRSFG